MIYHQSVFETWPIEDKSIQAIITSPPYWGLRKYDIPDIAIGDWEGQYGLEPDFKEYIEHTRLWMREAMRVLKDNGVLFLNIGDTYNGSKKGNTNNKQKEGVNTDSFTKENQGQPDKCKLLIPHRVAIALIDDGWTLRNDIIWSKPNAMPESCQDRFSKKFENIFMFSKQPKYYFNLDAVREKWDESSIARTYRGASGKDKYSDSQHGQSAHSMNMKRSNKTSVFKELSEEEKERTKNPGDIWRIATQPSPYSHYAMWPEKLVERMIKCSTRPGDKILDPFVGSGTTLFMAESLNRQGIGIDLGYKDIQDDRLKGIQKSLLEF